MLFFSVNSSFIMKIESNDYDAGGYREIAFALPVGSLVCLQDQNPS